jgi:hypothetical protein
MQMKRTMRDARRVALVVLTVVALAGAAWYIVYLFSRDQQQVTPLQWTQNARLQRGFQLIPVPVDPPAKAPPLEQVWRDLFPRMAKDAETNRLIKYLLDGAPCQFVVLDADEKVAEEALPKVPPAEGALILGVRPSPTWSEKWLRRNGTGQTTTQPGPDNPEAGNYVRCLDVGLTLAYLEHSPSGSVQIKNVQLLAINEYLVRHGLGCLLCAELRPEDFRAVVSSAEGARAYQAREIEEYVH